MLFCQHCALYNFVLQHCALCNFVLQHWTVNFFLLYRLNRFLNKLSDFDDLPDNTILSTMDVTVLYSSILHSGCIRGFKTYLDDGML